MITNKKDLRFYIAADRMLRGKKAFPGILDRIKEIMIKDHILHYLESMRKVAYYKNCMGGKKYICPAYFYHLNRFKELGVKLGFSIGYNCFGYGLVLPHYGTIVAGDDTRAGNFCVLHTSTCIEGGGKKIGNALYMGTGVILTGDIKFGDNISIAANSLVNNDANGISHALYAGSPAKIKKENYPAWYIRDHYEEVVLRIESLKKEMGL